MIGHLEAQHISPNDIVRYFVSEKADLDLDIISDKHVCELFERPCGWNSRIFCCYYNIISRVNLQTL